MLQPVDPEKTTVLFLPEVETLRGDVGIFLVHVEGEVQDYSIAFTLVKAKFFGGLKIDSMGWTGPLGYGKRLYESNAAIHGHFVPDIIVAGSNGSFEIPVEKIPFEEVDEYVKSIA